MTRPFSIISCTIGVTSFPYANIGAGSVLYRGPIYHDLDASFLTVYVDSRLQFELHYSAMQINAFSIIIIKVLIERSNLQLALIGYSINIDFIHVYTFAKRRIRPSNAYQEVSNANHSSASFLTV